MIVKTELFGDVEVKDADVITFPQGVIGLDDIKEFVLLDVPENPFFKWLQSIGDSSLAFLVVNPFQFIADYEFELSDGDKKILTLDKPKDTVTFTIVSIPQNDISKITANLLGPIVINIQNKRAKQLVLSDNKYSTKFPLFKEERKVSDEGANSKEACK